MGIVEARRPDGGLSGIVEVSLSRSGMNVMITDTDGESVLIPRYAWDGVVKEVSTLFEKEEKTAQKRVKQMKDDGDD